MSDVSQARSVPLALAAIPQTGAGRFVGLALMALAGTVILWLSARVSVPFFPVPMSMQTLAVMLIGGLYGSRLGAATVVLYLLEGAVGLPVFANAPFAGAPYLLGTTGGFLAGFIVLAYVTGLAVERGADRVLPAIFGAILLGDVLLFALGFVWLAMFATLASGAQGIGFEAAWTAGVLPFLLGDLVKVAIAALALYASRRAIAS